ncbi:MAG: histidine phosphatase family protein [Firmicutes bacterium]|nr:histidine phosphatase family protein [Bacillota bacterium]
MSTGTKSEIVLIRHGITTANIQRLYYGGTDVPLSEKGIARLKEQKAQGIYPDGEGADFYTSGMLRTEQTLEILYGEREHVKVPLLKELHFGELEMKSYEELEKVPEYKNWIMSGDDTMPPPGGESIAQFLKRVRKGFDEVRAGHERRVLELRHSEKEARSICVCHGGVISGIMNYIWPEAHKDFYEWIPDPGHGYLLSLEGGKVTGHKMF